MQDASDDAYISLFIERSGPGRWITRKWFIRLIVLGLIRVHVGAEVFFFICLFMHVGVCGLEFQQQSDTYTHRPTQIHTYEHTHTHTHTHLAYLS